MVATRLHIHPVNPQPRFIEEAVDIIQKGGVFIVPTDSCYALACSVDNKAGMDSIRQLLNLSPRRNFTLVCRDLSDLGIYAEVNNKQHKLIKANIPSTCAFILKASHELPKRLHHPKQKTIGLRVPTSPIVQALLDRLGSPFLSVTLRKGEVVFNDPDDIMEKFGKRVDLFIDAGPCGLEPRTMIDLTHNDPQIIRQGNGIFQE
jgi:tRNA threonylcarbamoyl adenosine modification protein (Sua5/YciO/YrdC/YwlC family)